ncbi:class I SAM-dependent methyltransferase [Bacillus horti]|uniref:16S rRNA (Guanine1207-N2)-methyltransferase n=1 Tax=Caldalkalibacillus horti TaxID=77523 RepID=A0ABT9VYW4_9BACI|nr:class I SAM-dependent methyltransferase [Bacillus horti]MDQ0166055.1 16S rRNA (guanine1207-N2)-methyltransferase [Bacillus horti]
MSDHYYSKQPQTSSQEALLHVRLRDQDLRFYTDRGVFSKKGVDFGSQLLIEYAEVGEAARILDVGCGYGPIGLSLAKESPARQVTMVDINERALHLCQKNAELNQLSNVRILESNLLEKLQGQTFDIILSNPPIRAGKDVVHGLFEQADEALNDGGELWVVIQKKQGSPSAFAKLEELYEKVEEVTKKKGYRIFRAKKGQKT